MEKYWQDPRLDDEGTYDYLVEELPQDSAKWERYYTKCDSCGKEHSLNFCATHYFYCWDGWDSMSYTECWKCRLKGKIYSIKAKTIKKIKQKIDSRKEYKELINKCKENGVPITEELQYAIKAIVNKEVAR